MTKTHSPLKTLGLYLASIAAVAVLALLLQPSAAAFGWYFCISFWALVAFDYVATQTRGVATRFAFEDRFIGYLFCAPFIWPARMLTLASRMTPVRS